jgi:hypothetical protein
MDSASDIAGAFAAAARCIAGGASAPGLTAAFGRLTQYLLGSHGLPLVAPTKSESDAVNIQDKLKASLREAGDDAELRQLTANLLKALEQSGSGNLPQCSISIDEIRGMIVRLEDFSAEGGIRLGKIEGEDSVEIVGMVAGKTDGDPPDNARTTFALGSAMAGESVVIIANSPGARLEQNPKRPRLDDKLAGALMSQIKGCSDRDVKFRSAYIMAALLRLKPSFAQFCLDEARYGYAASVQRLIDNFMANQAARASERGFECIDLPIESTIYEATLIALNEDAVVVDERHVLMALLRSTSGFQGRIQRDLEKEAFDRLLNIATSRRPTRRPPTAPELFEKGAER